MADDMLDKLVSPLASGALAALASFLAAARSFVGRVKRLEERVSVAENENAALKRELQEVRARPVPPPVVDLDKIEDAVYERFTDELKRFRSDLDKIEAMVENVHKSGADFAKEAELARFMSEVNTRWLQIERTLGNIEGTLRPLGAKR